MDIFEQYIYNFLFILLRAGIVISLLPFFGSKNFPVQFKIGFVIDIALVLTPIVELNISKTGVPLTVMHEVVVGIILGLTARFIFFAVEMAGQVVSNAMGLSIATIFNPDFGQSTEIARFYGMMAMLIFLSSFLLGFIYKAAPQMNIFFIGYPVYIFVGFVVILIGIPVFTHVIGGYLNGIKDEMIRVIAIARG